MIENFEKLVSDYLRDEAEARVVSKTPDSTSASWVRLTLINAPQEDLADHHTGYDVQLDCYAGADGGQPEAMSVAAAVRGALVTIADHDFTGAVASGSMITSFSRVPDTAIEQARERVIITATIYAHARP